MVHQQVVDFIAGSVLEIVQIQIDFEPLPGPIGQGLPIDPRRRGCCRALAESVQPRHDGVFGFFLVIGRDGSIAHQLDDRRLFHALEFLQRDFETELVPHPSTMRS